MIKKIIVFLPRRFDDEWDDEWDDDAMI